jgi:hypothetical protein
MKQRTILTAGVAVLVFIVAGTVFLGVRKPASHVAASPEIEQSAQDVASAQSAVPGEAPSWKETNALLHDIAAYYKQCAKALSPAAQNSCDFQKADLIERQQKLNIDDETINAALAGNPDSKGMKWP